MPMPMTNVPLPVEEGSPTLRELRKSRCLEVNELAAMLKVRENTVYRWERGLCVPPLHCALYIAKLMETTVDKINWWPHGLIT